MRQHIIGVFNAREKAETAVTNLVNAGISRDQLSIVGHRNSSAGQSDESMSSDQVNTEGAATGAAIGGIAGLALGLAALAIPGIGPIVAAGPLALALGGAGTGALAGGLIGSLVDIGVPEDEAQEYTEAVRRGGIIVAVQADEGQRELARSILEKSGAYDLSGQAQEWRREGWKGYKEDAPEYSMTAVGRETQPDPLVAPSSSSLTLPRSSADTLKSTSPSTDFSTDQSQQETSIPVVKEDLIVGKREVERGGVRVYSRVVNTPVEEEIRLREEKVRVERHPVDRPATEADFSALKEGEIRLTERSEEVVVGKQAKVVEEVVVGKEVRERTERIQDEIRHTEVDIEEDDDLPTRQPTVNERHLR